MYFLVLAQVEVAEKEQECIQSVAEMREDMAKTTSDANLIILGLEGALNNIEVCHLAITYLRTNQFSNSTDVTSIPERIWRSKT